MGKDNQGKLIVSLSQYLGLIVMMSSLFLGLIYWTDGNLIASIPITVALAAIIYILVDYFIKEKNTIARGGYRTSTIFLFFIYIALSFPISIICLHAINVEVFEKENIQNIGNKRIECIDKMEEDYAEKRDNMMIDWTAELENNVSTYLNTRSNGSKAVLEAEPYNLPIELLDASSKNNMIGQWTEQMNRNFDDRLDIIQKKSAKVVSNSKKALKNWDRFNINEQFNLLDEQVRKSKKELDESFIEITRRDLNMDITPYIKDKVLLTEPLALFTKHLNYMSFIIIFLIQLLIILPYLLTPRIIIGGGNTRIRPKKSEKTERYTQNSNDEITGTSL